MAGSDPNFDEAAFRDAIQFAARMGTANDQLMVPILHWDDAVTYTRADAAGRPYFFNNTQTPTVANEIVDLQVDTVVAVVERAIEGAQGTRIGMFRGSKLTLTVLDVDFDQIVKHGLGRFADSVFAGATEYRVQEIPRPDSLFGVDVYTIHCFSQAVVSAT